MRRTRRPRLPYLLLLPAVAVLAVGMGYPVYWQIVTSLQKYGLAQQFGQPPTFVGLDNYARILTDDRLWAVVVRSIAFCLINAFVTVGIGVGVALLMRATGRVVRLVLQVAMLLAWAMPMVAAVTVWKWLFDWRTGVVNWLLVRVGLTGYDQHNWLAQPLSFFFVATVIIVWMSVPFVALSVFAASDPGARRGDRGGHDRRGRPGPAVPVDHRADDPARPVDRAAPADHLGPAGVRPDPPAAGLRGAGGARRTCSATSSSSSASDARTSPAPLRSRSSCSR